MTERTCIDALLLRYEEMRAGKTPITPDELCRDCPDLLAELKARIQELEAVDAWLDPEPGARSRTDGAGPAAGVLAAETRYRILHRSAQGGLGEILLAEDEHLHRPVALKRLHGTHAHNPYSRRRFAREAEVTSRLEHPNIVPVHAVGQDREGRPYYTMRFVEGRTLEEAIRHFHDADRPGRDSAERRLALRQLLSRFVAVCNTIAYAHSRGVVHRDIKPSNIMLGPYGETLVVDWGLAKTLTTEAAEEAAPPEGCPDVGAAETQQGTVIGTPAYMSPEQAEGRIDQVGPASDVYSLGATLYSVLTGRAPYQGHEMAAVVEEVKRGEFTAPRRVRRGVPRALEAVCLKAMARQPGARYATALELATDVERWLADDPVGAWREPWLVRARRWLSRRRTLVAVVVSAVSVGALGLAYATWSLSAANARLAAINASEREAKQTAEESLAAVKALFVITSFPDSLGTRAERRQILRGALTAAEHLFPEQFRQPEMHRQVAELHLQLGDLILQIDSKQGALKEYRTCCDIMGRLIQSDPNNKHYRYALARGRLATGAALMELGRREEALDAYHQARAVMEGGPGPGAGLRISWDDTLAMSYHHIATATPDAGEALAYFDRAIRLQEGNLARQPGSTWHLGTLAQSYTNRGGLQESLNLPYEALASYEKGRSCREKLVNMTSWGDVQTHALANLADSERNIGRLYRRIDPAEAAKHYERALTHWRVIGDRTEVIQFREYRAKCHLERGALERARGNPEAARQDLLDGRKILEKLAAAPASADLWEVHADLARCHYHLGLLERDAGKAPEAAQEFRDVVDRVTRLEGRLGRALFVVERPLALAYLGEFRSATAAAGAVAGRGPRVRSSLYELACVFALSIEPARRAGEHALAGTYTRRGLELLGQAQAAGWFQTRVEIDRLKRDPDLQALRDADGFGRLLTDVDKVLAARAALRAGTVGVLAAPFGQGPLPAASTAFPGTTAPGG